MTTSSLFKKFLFVSFLGLSVAGAQAENLKAVLTKVSNPNPDVQEMRVEGLPSLSQFHNGDIIETDPIFLSQDKFLQLDIIKHHEYRVGDYYACHSIKFDVGNATYEPTILSAVDFNGGRYWKFLKVEPTVIEYQYQCTDIDELDELPAELSNAKKYKPVITRATLRIPITVSSPLDASSRL